MGRRQRGEGEPNLGVPPLRDQTGRHQTASFEAHSDTRTDQFRDQQTLTISHLPLIDQIKRGPCRTWSQDAPMDAPSRPLYPLARLEPHDQTRVLPQDYPPVVHIMASPDELIKIRRDNSSQRLGLGSPRPKLKSDPERIDQGIPNEYTLEGAMSWISHCLQKASSPASLLS